MALGGGELRVFGEEKNGIAVAIPPRTDVRAVIVDLRGKAGFACKADTGEVVFQNDRARGHRGGGSRLHRLGAQEK